MLLAVIVFTLVGINPIVAQDNLFNRIGQKSDDRVGEAIDNGLDKLEDGIGSLFGKNKKSNAEGDDNKKIEEQSYANQQLNNQANIEESSGTTANANDEPTIIWSKYDFIPGDEVIFEDNLENEENGEFPSRWDMLSGSVENAILEGENVIMFLSGGSAIVPYLKNPDQDYLPDVFTIEFDAYFAAGSQNSYSVAFHDLKNQNGSSLERIICLPGGIQGLGSERTYSGMGLWDKAEKNFWRHVSIGFNTRALKAYYDDERLLNIPHIEFNPTGLTISIAGVSNPRDYMLRNIRIAAGGQKLYDRYLQNGKIVASGIRFDANKATLKPESMGVINGIAGLMRDNPDISFSVEGHTDSDGDDAFNQTLSEQRAKAVVSSLVGLGIARKRLTSKGWGESRPLNSNDTPEDKANNRRVEFVKSDVEDTGGAISSGTPAAVTTSEETTSGEKSIIHAVLYEGASEAKKILDEGADINEQDKNGYTALIWASSYSTRDMYFEAAKLLIDEGADVNVRANDGNTAIIEAAGNSPEIFRMLLDRGADISAKKDDGTGAFYSNMVNMLLMGREITDKMVEVASYLLANGASVDESPASGGLERYTPLLFAVRENNTEITRFLIEHGADKTIENVDGDTPLSLAEKANNSAIIEILKLGD